MINNTPQQVPQQTLRPVYQMSTNNKSFLDMHYFLKRRGIKNNKFMLTLYDPDLAGIDPYDPNLNTIQKAKVLLEVRRNYWYFLREVVRVFQDGNPNGVPFKLDRGNLAFNFCSMYNMNIFFEMPRQVGKTTVAAIRYLYIYNFATANSLISVLHKDLAGAKDNLDKIKTLRNMLPSYLQMSQTWNLINGKKNKLSASVRAIQNTVNNNRIITLASARNEMAAANLLRGKTITLLWADEWAFCKFNDAAYINGMPALNTAFKNAKANNVPYGFTITTTAGILSSPEGKFAFDMIQDATEWDEAWYDLSPQQMMDIINSNMQSIFVYIKYTYIQLGLGEDWFFDICRKMAWNNVAIRREVQLEWIDQPENSPFDPDDIEALRGMVRDPMRTLMLLNKYKFNIYSLNGTATRKNPYGSGIPLNMHNIPIDPPIIGVDPSGGLGRDYSAISIIDSRTTELIAELKCNFLRIPDLARVLYCIVTTMMPNAVINIERNGVA